MCGCGGNKKPTSGPQRVRLARNRVAPTTSESSNTASVAPRTNFTSTPNTPEEDKKRIQKLRRDAIRKAFGT